MGKAILHLLGSNLTIKLCSLVFSFFLAKFYGASILGSYVLFISIYGLGLFTSKLGIFYALEKRISEIRKDENTLITTSLLVNLLFVLLTVGTLAIFNTYLEKFIGIDSAGFYLILCVMIGNLNEFVSVVIRAKKKMIIFSRVMLFREVIPKLLVVIIFFLNGGGIHLVIVSIIVGEAFALLYAIFFMDKLVFHKPNKTAFKSLYALTKFNAILEFRGMAFNWVDIWVVGLFLSREYVGVYQVAWQISGGILIVNKALTTACFPYFSEWFANNQTEKVKTYLKDNIHLFLLLPVPLLMGSLIYAAEIMTLFSDDFNVGRYVLMILMICTMFRSIQELYSKVLVAMDQSKLSFIASTYSGMIGILLNVVLTYFWGIEGAAIATTLGSLISFLICAYYLKKVLNYRLTFNSISYNLYASLIMLISLVVIKYQMSLENLFIGVSTGIVVWLVTLFTTKLYRKEFSRLIKSVGKRKGEISNV